MSVKPRVATTSKSECFVRGANVRFEVSNGGVVPRRLVVELFIDCIILVPTIKVEPSARLLKVPAIAVVAVLLMIVKAVPLGSLVVPRSLMETSAPLLIVTPVATT